MSEVLDADNLQEKGAFWVHDVKKIQTELFGSILLGWNTMAAGTCGGRQLFTTGLEGERKAGTRDWVSPSRPAPRDPLTSSRPYLPKFPEPLKVIPPARNQTLNTSLGGTLKAQTVTAVSGTGWQWCCVSDPRLFASFLGISRKSGMSCFLTSAQPQG